MDQETEPRPGQAWEVFVAFLRLGVTAFGGPVAHLAYFRREFVERRGWLGEAAFAELLALCHFLPGPVSSQLGMAIGHRRAGVAGAAAALVGFAAPAGALMIAFAYLAPDISRRFGEDWLHGLKVAAAAIVLQAVLTLGRTLAVGPVRLGLAVGAAAGLILVQGAVAQVLAIAAGAAFGWAFLREAIPAPAPAAITVRPGSASYTALIVFALLLAGLPAAAFLVGSPDLAMAGAFYRTGALAFGGGHVMLPLLEGEVVARGWINIETFLAGYGAAQAMPGPLFGFAGFVGATQGFATAGWAGGLLALTAIFLPGFLLVVGVLPWWDRVAAQPAAAGAVAGVGAVAVGLLAAAFWDPVLTSAVNRLSDLALIAAAFIFLTVARLPPWLVVAGFAVATGLFR